MTFVYLTPEHFNVLYRENWTREAEKVLRRFEQNVIRKAKTEGYDGGDSEDDSSVQWNFSGALLYSVTVITTIGESNSKGYRLVYLLMCLKRPI